MAYKHNSKTADDEPRWRDVDKSALPRIAFAERGDPDDKDTWKYPHHWVRGGTQKDDMGCWTDGELLLHVEGLDVARRAANGARSGKQASPAVKEHLAAHQAIIDKRNKPKKEKGMNLIEQLAEFLGAERALELVKARPDASEIGDFLEEIKGEIVRLRGEVESVSASLHEKESAVSDLQQQLEAAKRAPAVVTLASDPADPPAPDAKSGPDAWKQEWESSAELQAEFPSPEYYIHYKEHEDEIEG